MTEDRYTILILLLLLQVVLTGCASTKTISKCAHISYDQTSSPCLSPYQGCDPNNIVVACPVKEF